MTCRFAKTCEYYRKENVTCQDPTAENGYCGAYNDKLVALDKVK